MGIMQDIKLKSSSEFRHDLIKNETANPALQRLKKRLLSEVDHSQVISSYDRMHHRHSRS